MIGLPGKIVGFIDASRRVSFEDHLTIGRVYSTAYFESEYETKLFAGATGAIARMFEHALHRLSR